MTSARLATGTAGQPTWVKPAEIAKYPTGPLVGTSGAPAAMPVEPGRGLNLTSARLATGTAGQPTWVKPAEIAKYPTGPLVGSLVAQLDWGSSGRRFNPVTPELTFPQVRPPWLATCRRWCRRVAAGLLGAVW